MADVVTAAGGCLCGAVRFKVSGAPIRMAQCHCSDCQKASGTGHMSNAIFNASDVEINGTTSSYASLADSGNTLTRHFCPTCGGRVFLYSQARPGMIVMAAGAFDDMSWFRPEMVLFTKRRPAWDMTTADVPNFDAGPPRPAPKPA